jgi:polar amino acid transport system substrate-binding protein
MANEPKQITFSCWIDADLPAFVALESLYRESFAALGYAFAMVSKPPLRSLAEANSGMTDGECARVSNYPDAAPNSPLKRIDVMIAKTNLDAWSYDNTIKLNGPVSLINSKYKIAYGKGAVAMQLLLSRLPLENLQPVSSIALGIKMLVRKRFDVLISPRAIFKQELARNPVDVELYFVGTILELEGYPYLHERHEDITAAFTEELRKRTPEGGLTLP